MNKNKSNKIIAITKEQMFNLNKPRYNPYQTGYGIVGDTKYNRNKVKEETNNIIKEEYGDEYDQ